MEQIKELSFVDSITQELLFFGIIILCVVLAQQIIDILFNKYFERLYRSASPNSRKINKKRYDTLAITFRRLASIIMWVVVIIILLGHYGVNYSALLTGAGAVGIFFGIAGKDIVMDLYVGIMALIEDQYRVGDVIWIDQDHSGSVEDITLRTIKLRDIDGNVHIVPHSLARAIINKTYDYSTVNIEIGVGYTSDLEIVKSLINEVGDTLAKDDAWVKKFIEPIQYQTLLQYDKSQVILRAQGKVKPGEQWDIASEYRNLIKNALDANGIEVPLGQNVLRTVVDTPIKPSKLKP
jgi:moderate conductance mechanosensitive channel